MKKNSFRIIVIVLVSLGLLVAWGEGTAGSVKGNAKATAQDVKQKTKEALKTTREYTQQQKNEYQKRVAAKIKEYDQRIDELKKKAADLKKEKKADLDEKIEALQEKKMSALKKLQNLKAASGKAWEDLKDGTDASMNELEHAFKGAFSHFK